MKTFIITQSPIGIVWALTWAVWALVTNLPSEFSVDSLLKSMQDFEQHVRLYNSRHEYANAALPATITTTTTSYTVLRGMPFAYVSHSYDGSFKLNRTVRRSWLVIPNIGVLCANCVAILYITKKRRVGLRSLMLLTLVVASVLAVLRLVFFTHLYPWVLSVDRPLYFSPIGLAGLQLWSSGLRRKDVEASVS